MEASVSSTTASIGSVAAPTESVEGKLAGGSGSSGDGGSSGEASSGSAAMEGASTPGSVSGTLDGAAPAPVPASSSAFGA